MKCAYLCVRARVCVSALQAAKTTQKNHTQKLGAQFQFCALASFKSRQVSQPGADAGEEARRVLVYSCRALRMRPQPPSAESGENQTDTHWPEEKSTTPGSSSILLSSHWFTVVRSLACLFISLSNSCEREPRQSPVVFSAGRARKWMLFINVFVCLSE